MPAINRQMSRAAMFHSQAQVFEAPHAPLLKRLTALEESETTVPALVREADMIRRELARRVLLGAFVTTSQIRNR